MTTATKSEAYLKGEALCKQLHGEHSGDQMVRELQDICPDHIGQIYEWAFTGIMARPGLDILTREYLIIASCVTLGYATQQLKAHIEAALSAGGTKEQIVEVILQMLFYAGGAATSNALRAAKEVFNNSH
ncbi:carboxymuconolactone decarboxylase family protein [Mucilaginibacter sp. X4EP1]|jgi:4-carboxymuconolactone decarboxylase|uniref:carboxymuconolactone decarboxylase family protein n=1 Tax=Mucilaginibacter sp. X4EP1 TaxID=2723092 RepID=UPI00216A255B|nr:carboxymuconolactone decarboxylase family protein [Mucilaginibacter sp. X4EP1]MCS3811970.1 4-carboxymuconolactone decarboxylase [Mucilaginibacter sp. X4EP1]